MGKYVEVRSSVRNLHWDIVTILCRAGWQFVETIVTADANSYVDTFRHILRTTTSSVTVEGSPVSTNMYLMVEHNNFPGNGTDGTKNFRQITFVTAPNYFNYNHDTMGQTIDTKRFYAVSAKNAQNLTKVLELPSLPLTVSFIQSEVTTTNFPFILDVPINVWGNVSVDSFNLIFQGEPSIQTDGYGRVGHVYCGKIESYKEGNIDIGGNWVLSGSSSESGKITDTNWTTKYGSLTSDGVGSVAVYRTYGGLLWQKHYASIIADDKNAESAKSELYQPSAWTGKFHLSPIYVFHATEGKRGMLENILVCQKQGILHLDELEIARPIDECNPCPKDSSNNLITADMVDHPQYSTYWKRDKYKYFRPTSKFHFLDYFNTAFGQSGFSTTGIGLAIKMETEANKLIKFNTAYDILTGGAVSSWTSPTNIPKLEDGTNASTHSILANTPMSTAGVTLS